MPSHEFGQRMHNDVGAVVDRPDQDRRGHCVVDDERHAIRVSNLARPSISQIFPAGLPTLSQKTPRVFSSISASMAAGSSIPANRT